jgi:hypothetical protein
MKELRSNSKMTGLAPLQGFMTINSNSSSGFRRRDILGLERMSLMQKFPFIFPKGMLLGGWEPV